MTEIVFYQCADRSHALPMLLEKSLAQGWRAVVRALDQEALIQLDRFLWTYRDDGFLPHSSARDGFEHAQPIWLTTEAENPNKAELLVLLHDAEAFGLDEFKRCLYLFNGEDDTARKQAELRRRDFSGHNITFWRQSRSGWVKDEEQNKEDKND